MKRWNNKKLGNWFWRNYWYRVSWYISELKYRTVVRYLLKHHIFTDSELGTRKKFADTKLPIWIIFKGYDKWFKE